MHAYHPSDPTLVMQECGLCVPFFRSHLALSIFFSSYKGGTCGGNERRKNQRRPLCSVMSLAVDFMILPPLFIVELKAHVLYKLLTPDQN
jgi:hypothetical protein